MPNDAPTWPDEIYRVLLDADVRQVAYVPDSGHSRLITLCEEEPRFAALPLTTEEEGIALLAGAWLGGQPGVLLMQSSGVGNCINMLSLTRSCRFPLLILVTMRGEWGEFNPWQVPMGQATADVLRLAGVTTYRADEPAMVAETVAAAAGISLGGPGAAAVLIGQRLIGTKTFAK